MLKIRKRPPLKLTVPRWVDRPRIWLARRIHNMSRTQRIVCSSMAVIVLLSVIIPTVLAIMKNQSYKLSADVQSLVGVPNKNLASKITYNSQKDSWQFNQVGIKSDQDAQQASMPTVEELKAQLGGSGEKDDSLYAVDLPASANEGVSYYDTNTNLSFSMVPEFNLANGRRTNQGQLVYPAKDGAKLVYTAKANGMKEDIVLTRPIGDEVEFSYRLNLPDTLEAKIQSDGSLGVFSPNPVLFGNISFGDGQDKEKILSARQTATKDHLLFVIPAPVIIEAGGKKSTAPAKFTLSGDKLTVSAKRLRSLQYPLSIDPSVVVTSSGDFATGAGDNIAYNTDQVARGEVTGGGISGGWSNTASGSISATLGSGTTAYNSYLYKVGGTDATAPTNDVYYAPINSNGTIGAWSSTTSLPTNRTYPATHAYNGILYTYGGYTSGTSALNTVIYAKINSNGTLGSWNSASNSMGTAVCRFGSSIAGGYLYAAGGATGTVSTDCGNSSSTMTNTLQYAPILADGDVGAWTTSPNTFTNARKDVGLAISNGFIYLSSGTTDGITTYQDTQIAKISSDGSIGAWRTSDKQIPTNGKYRFGYKAYNGYLYLSGGTNNLTGTLYAPIYSSGDIGEWQSSATMATGRYGHGYEIYKGYVYYIGGNDGSGYLSDTGYAKIDPAGRNEAYTQSTTFVTMRRGAAVVAYNGFAYVIGGEAGAAPVTTIRRATINSDGTFSAWTTQRALPAARGHHTAVAYNGYLYVLGGCSSAFASCTTASNNVSTVYRSAIAADGTLGTWSTDTAFSTARYGLSAVAYNGYLYIMGGLNGSTFQNSIQYHAIGANGAISGAWSTSSYTISTARAYFGTAVNGGKLYIAGGCSAGALTCTTAHNDIQYGTLGASGDLTGSLTTNSTNLTNARGMLGFTIANGYAYVVGGHDDTTYYTDTAYAPLDSNGSIGGWLTGGDMVATIGARTVSSSIGVFAYGGNLYTVAGFTAAGGFDEFTDTTQFSRLANGGGGSAAGWTSDSTGTISTARTESQTVAYNGYLYTLGGRDGSNSSLSSVEYAPLNADGTVGSWSTTSSFADGRVVFAAAAMNDYMYILGGRTTGYSYYKDIQYARINSNGTLGAWGSAGGNVSNGGQGACTVAYRGYIYSIGGYDGSTDYNSVQYAAQNSNGTVGSWQTANSFTGARSNLGCVAYGDYIYILGGEDTTGKNDVQYAQLNSNGSLGSWSYTTGYNLGRTNHGAVAYNGFMYIIGGVDSIAGEAGRNDLQYAPINTNGTLGQWQHSPSPGNYTYADVAINNGFIYIPAQYASSLLNTTTYTSLNTIARIGRYDKLIDIGLDSSIAGISYNGVLPDSVKSIDYRTAGSDGIFGATYNASSPPSPGGGDPCSGTYGSGRYVWLSVTFNDTSTAVFPDSSGTPANITDMTIDYLPLRAAPNQRLMHGKFFSSETLQPLDTCTQ